MGHYTMEYHSRDLTDDPESFAWCLCGDFFMSVSGGKNGMEEFRAWMIEKIPNKSNRIDANMYGGYLQKIIGYTMDEDVVLEFKMKWM